MSAESNTNLHILIGPNTMMLKNYNICFDTKNNKLDIGGWINRTFDKAGKWIHADGCVDGFRDKTCVVVTTLIKNVNITDSEFTKYHNFVKHEIYYELHT